MMEFMIVDDDEMVIFLHRVILAESMISLNPVIAHNGREALDYLINNGNKDTHFIIFLDINMPGMSGWEFLDELNRIMPDNKVQVVIVSSSIDLIDRNKSATYHNVIGYVEKPLQIDYCREIKKKLTLEDY